MELRLVPQLDSSTQLFQSDFWAEFKGQAGWRSYRISGDYQGQNFSLLLLTRKLLLGLGFGYCPYGPEIKLPQEEWQPFLIRLARDLQGLIPLSNFFVRFDLPWLVEQRPQLGGGLRTSNVRVQPRATVLLDLQNNESQLLAQMHKKWRYNIGLSERRGVVVQSAGLAELDRWYSLYRVTAARDRIGIHQSSYYHALFTTAQHFPQVQLELLLASLEGELLGGIIVAHCGGQSVYLYGASANHGREHMPNYLLQWRAICASKARGSASYDFFGIPETDDPMHPMAGLYRFKTGFGGEICQRMGVCDYPYSKTLFVLFRGFESARAFYHQQKKRNRC